MLKKYRVADIYHTHLCCDVCGQIMRMSQMVYNTDPPQHLYQCECGYTKISHDIYPMTHFTLDEENAEVVIEGGVTYGKSV